MTRPRGASFTGLSIERVNVASGAVEVVYRAQHGAHVGVVTVSPDAPARYAFIHGPEHPDSAWQYDFHHRRGVIVSEPDRELAITLDALDITAPTRPARAAAAMCTFSVRTAAVLALPTTITSCTNAIRRAICATSGGRAAARVNPPKQHPREYDGSHYCVLVSETVPQPQPGSDQINRAYEEGWIGREGYRKADGSRQRWALAFIGDTLSASGEKLPEVFIVDLPENDADYARAGALPLQGTESELPAPPQGVRQRRVTLPAIVVIRALPVCRAIGCAARRTAAKSHFDEGRRRRGAAVDGVAERRGASPGEPQRA